MVTIIKCTRTVYLVKKSISDRINNRMPVYLLVYRKLDSCSSNVDDVHFDNTGGIETANTAVCTKYYTIGT